MGVGRTEGGIPIGIIVPGGGIIGRRGLANICC